MVGGWLTTADHLLLLYTKEHTEPPISPPLDQLLGLNLQQLRLRMLHGHHHLLDRQSIYYDQSNQQEMLPMAVSPKRDMVQCCMVCVCTLRNDGVQCLYCVISVCKLCTLISCFGDLHHLL